MNIELKMAGNTNVGCVRKNNEDNFCVSADLQAGMFANASRPWGAEQVVDLGPKGVLLVVADGMGGTNAGEVASERAVDMVAQYFAPERITDAVTGSDGSILAFMEQAIVACDKEVKNWGDSHPESKGMGTTIVMGWIIDGKLYVAWCGDSRAYVYRPGENKIYQVSKDHSYVQLLVDKAMLTREETFDHPQGNIITRSLSHGQPAALPESLPQPYALCNGDIVLLCSDGLSGMLRDQEMADVISNSPDDAEQIVTNLINGARNAGGSDNITVVIAKVEKGGTGTDDLSKAYFAVTEAALDGPGMDAEPQPTPLFRDEPAAPQRSGATPPPFASVNTQVASYAAVPSASAAPAPKRSDKKTIISVIATLAILFTCAGGWFAYNKFLKPAEGDAIAQADTDEPEIDPMNENEEVNNNTESQELGIGGTESGVTEMVVENGKPVPVPTPAPAPTTESIPADTVKKLVERINTAISVNGLPSIKSCKYEKGDVTICFTTTMTKDGKFDRSTFDKEIDDAKNLELIKQLFQVCKDQKPIERYYYSGGKEEIPNDVIEGAKSEDNPNE